MDNGEQGGAIPRVVPAVSASILQVRQNWGQEGHLLLEASSYNERRGIIQPSTIVNFTQGNGR